MNLRGFYRAGAGKRARRCPACDKPMLRHYKIARYRVCGCCFTTAECQREVGWSEDKVRADLERRMGFARSPVCRESV